MSSSSLSSSSCHHHHYHHHPFSPLIISWTYCYCCFINHHHYHHHLHHHIIISLSIRHHHDHHIIIIVIIVIIIIIIIINLTMYQVDCSFVNQPGRPILAILTNWKSGVGWKNKIISCKSGHSFKNVPISRSKWHPPFVNWSTLRLFNHHLLSGSC